MSKRFIDVTIAGFLLLLSLPLLLICAILIKMDSKGPALFRQLRMGRRYRSFEMLKLRTMHTANKGLPYCLGVDPRITRAGHWLRKHKVDELPQLWNVLRGDMSLVGPRPMVPELAREFRKHYERLLVVRPGLTDPATLKYRYENEILALESDPLHHFKTVVAPDKIRISLDYVDRATSWSDLGLMLKTAYALLPRAKSARRTFRRAVPSAFKRAKSLPDAGAIAAFAGSPRADASGSQKLRHPANPA